MRDRVATTPAMMEPMGTPRKLNDIDTAKALRPTIADEMAERGVKP